MKKIAILLVVLLLMSNICALASTNKPFEKLGDGLDNVFYGAEEVPSNIDETGTKGSPAYPECTEKTNDDVGRGIVRVVGGAWRLLTFWYPEED
jgi:hypothetical protein